MKLAEISQIADWKTEKHVPFIEAPERVTAGESFTVRVTVGKEIVHTNSTEHHIRWIRLYFRPDGGKFAYDVALSQFDAHGESAAGPNRGPVCTEPVALTTLKLYNSGILLASAYCNIHGQWEAALPIKVEF